LNGAGPRHVWDWSKGLAGLGCRRPTVAARDGVGVRSMPNRDEQRAEYGSDAPWPNVVWTIITILCACGLAVLPFVD